MAGDIKKFVTTFNEELEKAISKTQEKKSDYIKIYNECISLTASRDGIWPEDPSVKTIGDLYKYVFPDPEKPENNEPSFVLGNTKYTPYYKDYLDDMTGKSSNNPELKEKYEKLKRQGSQRLLERYKDIKTPGYSNPSLYSAGQYWFDVFMYVSVTGNYNQLNESKQDIFSDDQLKNFGTVSLAVFSRDDIPHGPTGSYLLHRDIAADYYEFSKLVLRCEQDVSEITGVNIGLQETWNTESFGGLKTQYRGGVYTELIKDPTFNLERGNHVENQAQSDAWKVPIGEFIGDWENMLLYKAVLEAGDNYKYVTLPYSKPTPEVIPDDATIQSPPVESKDTFESGDIVFNVEKENTFTVVSGTVSGTEFILVPDDNQPYVFDNGNQDDFEDLGEEYQEAEFAGLEEADMAFEGNPQVKLAIGTEVEYPTPPLDPNAPPGPNVGTSGPATYKDGNGMSAKDWEKNGTMVDGSKVPSNLSGPPQYTQKVTINDTMKKEYIPTIKGITGYTNGAKLLAIVMAQKEGFKAGTRSYRTNNPGNIGNTDSGSNKQLKTLADGIKLQLDYITKVANGQHSAYPLGQVKVMKPYYSPEIAKNNGPNGPYKGMTAYLPGYKFTYTGMIEQYCKIYATGSRTGNSYITMIVSWFRQNGYNTVTEETTIKQILALDNPAAILA
jgi:hypothetical protein